MFLDLNTTDDPEITNIDLCIIGSGAAGISLACEFLNSSLNVLLLEGGGLKQDDQSQKMYDLETSKLPIENKSRIRTFGGTTTVWGGGWKLLDEMDFEVRDWIPFSGWPINRRDLDPYYDRAAKLNNGPMVSDFDLNEIKKYPENKNKYIVETKDLSTVLLRVLPSESLDFGKKFHHFLSKSTSLKVLLNAHVTRLIFDKNTSTVTSLSVQTLSGKKQSIRAKRFILACGGIENARLLLYSDIGNEYDQVGRYYMDHPKCAGGAIILNDKHQDLSLYWKPQDIGGLTIAGLQLSPKSQAEQRVLNSYVQLRPWYIPDDRVLFALKFFTHPNIIFKLFRKLFKHRMVISELRLKNYIEQEPRPENRVLLSDKNDVLGNPIAKISWTISEFDLKSLKILHKTLKQDIEYLGIGKFISPFIDPSKPQPVFSDSSHHMGTTRMGSSPQTSVVDANCRVHGTSNLFVAGSSVFPTSGHANPTATIIALAIRLADHTKGLS